MDFFFVWIHYLILGFLITSMIHCRSQGLILQVWYNRSRCMGLIRLITLLTWTGFIIPPWNISDEIGFSHHTSWYFWSAWGFLSRWNITFSYCGFNCGNVILFFTMGLFGSVKHWDVLGLNAVCSDTILLIWI